MAIAVDEIFFKVTKLQRILIVAAVCILLMVGFLFSRYLRYPGPDCLSREADWPDKNRYRESGANTCRRSKTKGPDSGAGAKASNYGCVTAGEAGH